MPSGAEYSVIFTVVDRLAGVKMVEAWRLFVVGAEDIDGAYACQL